jgi:WxcM-like, C-terminal
VENELQIEKAPAGRLDAIRWVALPSHRDARGVLTAVESGIDVPFDIRRVYFLHDIAGDRGGHAHRETWQVVAAINGRCELVLSNGTEERSFVLDDPARGLFLGPMLFIRMRDFTPGTIVLVMASTHYDKTRSVRSWEEYREAIEP